MKAISDFTTFQCSTSVLDQIKGGKSIEDVVFTGCGADGDGGTTCDQLVCYDDGSWKTLYY